MKKILLLIIFMILLSGCEASYTIEINGNVFNEILVVNSNSRASDEIIIEKAASYIPTDMRYEIAQHPVPGVSYYETEKVANHYGDISLIMRSQFSLEEYRYGSVVNNYARPFNLTNENGVIEISGGIQTSFQNYRILTELTVRLVTDDNLIYHNADEVRAGVLYWHFTRENYRGREINIRLGEESPNRPDNSTNEPSDDSPALWETDEDGYFGLNTLIIIYSILFGIGIIAGIFIYIKIKNSNR